MGRIFSACRQLTAAGLLAYLGFLPSLAAGGLAMLTASPKAAVLLGTLAGLAAGPGLAGLYATARFVLRGRPGRWWKGWRRAVLKNVPATCLLGALSVALLCRWQTAILLAGGAKHAPWPLWVMGWGLIACLNEGWARLAGGTKGMAPLRSLAAGSLHFFWWAALCVGFPLSYVVVLPLGYGPLLTAVLAIQNPTARRRVTSKRKERLPAAEESPAVQPANGLQAADRANPAKRTEPAQARQAASAPQPVSGQPCANSGRPLRGLPTPDSPKQSHFSASMSAKPPAAGHPVHRRKPTGVRKKRD